MNQEYILVENNPMFFRQNAPSLYSENCTPCRFHTIDGKTKTAWEALMYAMSKSNVYIVMECVVCWKYDCMRYDGDKSCQARACDTHARKACACETRVV